MVKKTLNEEKGCAPKPLEDETDDGIESAEDSLDNDQVIIRFYENEENDDEKKLEENDDDEDLKEAIRQELFKILKSFNKHFKFLENISVEFYNKKSWFTKFSASSLSIFSKRHLPYLMIH